MASAFSIGQRVLVRWTKHLENESAEHSGKVLELRFETRRGGVPFLNQVKVQHERIGYATWYELREVEPYGEHEPTVPTTVADDDTAEVFVVGPSRWQQFHIVCQYSRERLTDPAKISSCRHPACCNFAALQSCLSSMHVCPVVGCDVKSTSLRVVRDDALREAIAALPPTVEACWLRGTAELSIEQPAEVSAASTSSSIFRPRKRRPNRSDTSRSARPRRLEAEAAEGEEDDEVVEVVEVVEEAEAADAAPELVTEADGVQLHLSRRSNNSGYAGVYATAYGTFSATHVHDGIRVRLGTFGTAVDAAVAYARHMQSLGSEEEEGANEAGGEEDEEEEEEEEEIQEVAEPATYADGVQLQLSSTHNTG